VRVDTKQTMAEHVQHLETHGYVVRVPDPHDRRAKLVLPTDRGHEVIAIAQGLYLNSKQGSRSLWARTAPTPYGKILRPFGVGSPRAPDRTKESHVNPRRCHRVLPSRLRAA
jgi:MarR family